MLMRRVDVDDGEGSAENDGQTEREGTKEEKRVFKTGTGAGTAVLKAGLMEERGKMSWFCDLGPAEEVFEIANFDGA